MTTIKASEARIPPKVFGEVAYNKGRVCISKNKSEKVYLVSEDDFKTLEKIEDLYWGLSAREVIDKAEATGEEPRPWSEVKKELGL
jgi:PHD/YefM family antitoxin component YafN of YafNO toxin-antitoxin module